MRLIDADAFINDARDRYCKDCDKRKGIKSGKRKFIYEIGDVPCRACDVDDMVNDIESAPTVDAVERKKGNWVGIDDEPCETFECDRCGFVLEDWIQGAFYNFCPNCGAEMRKGERDGTQV